MAGVLKPRAATLLVGAIRKKYPDLPIHVHTHDSAGTGVASMVACAQAGADAVDAAIDSMSGMTSQPSVGAILASLEGTDFETGLDAHQIRSLDSYWAQLRLLYSPFEAGLTGPDPEVYEHEIPGGQLTNLIFQASQQGLGEQWAQTKKAYEHANDLLGDIVKVTPTSKVVGDLAQFMVSNNLSHDDVLAKADQLDFPSSVLEFFEGLMGQPYGGFPEPLRSQALRDRRKMDKRPGLYLEPIDLAKIKTDLKAKWGDATECDVASYAMYPKVFDDYKKWTSKYGDLSVLPTRYFLARPEVGEEFHVELEKGKVLILKLLAIGPLSEQTGLREVFYEMNGETRVVTVEDQHAAIENVRRPKADPTDTSQVGSPMSGVLVEVRVKDGSDVMKGDPIAVLSAMKMVSYSMRNFKDSDANNVLGNGHLRPSLRQDRRSLGPRRRLSRFWRPCLQARQVSHCAANVNIFYIYCAGVLTGRVAGSARAHKGDSARGTPPQPAFGTRRAQKMVHV